jgi:uncharacterized protein YggE
MRAFALAALAGLVLGGAAAAQAPDRPGTMRFFDGALLTVTADGETKVVPDMATINVGVVTQAPTADAAVADNSRKMNAVMAALKKAGVADKDIQTANLSVNPQYRYGQNEPPKLTGYEAQNNVTVKVRNLKNVGKAVDAVVAVGSNQINGISFGVEDDAKAMDAARVAAMKKARARAELYADAANLKVQRIVSIVEGGAAAPIYPVAMMRAEAAAAPPPPVAPGELTLTASVTVTFALK